MIPPPTFATVLFITLAVWTVCGLSRVDADARPLILGKTIKDKLKGGEAHSYNIALTAGQYLHLVVEQKGIDVAVTVFGSDGKKLVEVDTPNGTRGPEPVSFISEDTGNYRLEVRYPIKTKIAGNYELKVKELRTATEKDRVNVAAQNVFREGQLLALQRTAASFQGAIKKYEESLRLYHAAENRYGEAVSLNSIGATYFESGEFQKALEYYNEALLLRRSIIDRSGEAMTLGNIGVIYWRLGENLKALDSYKKAGKLFQMIGDKLYEARIFVAIGGVYADLRESHKAINFYKRALPVLKAIGDKRSEDTTLYHIGTVYYDLGDKKKALEYFNQVLPRQKTAGNGRDLGSTLRAIGRVHLHLGEGLKSLEYYDEALQVNKTAGDRRGEAATLNELQNVWAFLGNPRLAIFYGKQSVNKYQELRQAVQGLDKQTQQSYLKLFESAYRKLAEILIAEGRIAEAERVLEMLKQEELFEYLRRGPDEIEKLKQRADLRPEEAEALRRYNEFADRITQIGADFGKLQNKKNQISEGAVLSPEEQKRLNELAKQLEDASIAFQVFLRQLAEEFAKKSVAVSDVAENEGLKSDLKMWGGDTVFLYTLVGDDRYRIILTTPDVQTNEKFDIKAAELNKKIADFRAAIQNPSIDPRPLGKELYDILIKPVEKDLEGARAKTLLWSLDGALRLLPLAALWDGKQYFGQKYQNVIITLASRTRLGESASSNWRALGVGVTQAQEVTEANGSGKLRFNALPAVKTELEAIVRDEQAEQTEKGVLPGRRLLDADFTETTLKENLGKGYKVVHIASHFSLNPGDITKSFLLLGDGQPLTMDKIRNSPQLRFNEVELLTLSACETAVVEKDANGREVESFGVIAQRNGAKAIMATLWSVADESTSLLMSEFYRFRKENPKLTKAEALQLAQKAMIEGRLKSSRVGTGCRSELVKLDGSKQTQFMCDVNAPFSHPYFWSSFVLIGNWR